jgi:ABC-type Fe3+-hydroxamate transport system substrate-binding protein
VTAQRRVVSLVPSVTETLVAWGVAPIACTRFCEQPDIAHVGGTKDPAIDAIVALTPDVVVMCEEENRREDAAALNAAGVATAALAIDSVADVAPALRALAAVVGVAPAAIAGLPGTAELSGPSTPGGPGAPPSERVRAFVPIWRRPWMSLSGGTYGSSLLAALGVTNVFADADARYPEVTLESARAARPDVVLAPSEPYPFRERHVEELATVAPVVLVDGQDLFWWGVRTEAALDRLGHALADLGLGRGG